MASCLGEGWGFGPVVVVAIGQRQEKRITATLSPRRGLPLASLQPQNATVGPVLCSITPWVPTLVPMHSHVGATQRWGSEQAEHHPPGTCPPMENNPADGPSGRRKHLIQSHLRGGVAIQKIIEI